MKNAFKNYKFSILLLLSIIVGGFIGIIFGNKANILEPFGNLFINLLFMILTPLVFFCVSSAVANINSAKRFGKIMGSVVIIFTITALISAIIGLIGVLITKPMDGINLEMFKNIIKTSSDTVSTENTSILNKIVSTITVSDFVDLFSRKNILQLIMFSLIFGASVSSLGEKGKPIAKLLESGSAIMMKAVNIVMCYAPIGLCCYFATIIGQIGTQILKGYLKIFILYLVLSVIYYFVVFTLYAYFSGGKTAIKVFWQNAIAPSVTALATCSSAACIPINLETTKKMGVPSDIAETVIPLGASTHKDGSVFGGVMKVIFLLALFGRDINNLHTMIGIILVAFLVGAVMGAIPGGGMIGEALVISVYGFPLAMLPLLTIISTIIDAPATLLNSTGNTVCSMMITRLVEGKSWINKATK